MTRKESLEALTAAIVAGDDAEVSSLLRMMASKARDNGTIWPSHDAAKAFNGSLDAAKALRLAVIPGPVPKMICIDARTELLRILKELIGLEQA